jgi:hypothetical protein
VTNQATPEPQSAATLDEEAAVVVNCSESRLESTYAIPYNPKFWPCR